MDSLIMTGILFYFIVFFCNLRVGLGQGPTFNVLQYGAKGDGKTDDSAAFMKAWEAFCGANEGVATIVVPAGYNFFLRESTFKGPCRSKNLHIQILGTLLAPTKDVLGCSKAWLFFLGISGLTIDGTGMVDGQGQAWWDRNATNPCGIPTALRFEGCDGLQVRGLAHVNGPGPHMYVDHSKDVTLSNLTIVSPKDSHNTDGIDVGNSTNVNIQDSLFETGDDCIAIKGNTYFVNITRVTCGPGHGISIGSLGGHGQDEKVENVNVWDCHFNGAESATKIKTWPGGRGYARAIKFWNITLNQTGDPIFIDQHYMHNAEQPQAVKVSDVTFSWINGTCLNERAIILDCAKIGCTDIGLYNINITSIDPSKPASTICNYTYGTVQNSVPSVPCLSK